MGKKKLKVYQEEAKLRQTTHWDLDYMTTDEIDALYGIRRSQKNQDSVISMDTRRVHGHPIHKADRQPSRQRPQSSFGKVVLTFLLRPMKALADLLRDKVSVYSVDR